MAARFSADAQDYTNAIALGSQGALTVSCWFKVSVDRNTYSTPWSIDNSTANNWCLQTAVDGTTMGVVADGNTLQNMGSVTVANWYYACLVVNGSTGTLYYKAATASSLSTVAISGGTTTVNAATLRIGESPWGTEWLNGCIAAFKFWTAQLSAAEVENECRQYVPGRLLNQQTFYPFVRTETADYSGNGRTLTGGSGTATEDGPPIPWQVIRPRLILPASLSGTNAPATEATATGGALDAVIAIGVNDTGATATVLSLDAVATVAVTPADVTVSGVANDAVIAIGVNDTGATATALSLDTVSALTVAPADVTGTVVANDATISTSAATNANAVEAGASGAALDAVVAIGVNDAGVTVSSIANDSVASVAIVPADVSLTSLAVDAVPAVAAQGGGVTSSALAQDGLAVISVTPADVTATGQANDATVSISGSANVPADVAPATGAANDPTASVATGETGASGTAVAPDAVVSAAVQVVGATGSAAGQDASTALSTFATGALSVGGAFDAVIVIGASATPAVATGSAAALDAMVAIQAVSISSDSTAGALDALFATGARRGEMRDLIRAGSGLTTGNGTAPSMHASNHDAPTMRDD